MGEVSRKIIDEYRTAREEEDYPTQAGILAALLYSVLYDVEPNAQIARETAEAILDVRSQTR